MSPDIRSTLITRLRAVGCVFAEDEADLLIAAATTASDLDAMTERRIGGLPLEYVLGWVEFHGLRIAIDPGVFVPRRRTAFLASAAIGLLRDGYAPDAVVVDLCCGSGAIGAAVLAELPDTETHAADVDSTAVRCARRNLPAHRVHEGDLYDALPSALRGRIDVLIANAPYVPTDAIALMPPEARDHEPTVALNGGRDGLDVLRRVIVSAPQWLAPDGYLLVESSRRQAPRVLAAFREAGLGARISGDAETDATIVLGVRLSRGNG